MCETSGGDEITTMEDNNIVIKIPNGANDSSDKANNTNGLNLNKMVRLWRPAHAAQSRKSDSRNYFSEWKGLAIKDIM